MQYESVEHMRGVWGLEDRLYSAEEISRSFHLQSAVNAGALVLMAYNEPLSADKPQVETIDVRDSGSDAASEFAEPTSRQRRKEKEN